MYFSYEYHDENMPFASMAKNHYHINTTEIYYLEKGECRYFIEGKTYRVMAGDIVILPKNVIHKTTYKAPYSRKIINFSDDVMPEYWKDTYKSLIYVYRNYDIQGELKAIFKRIHNEYTSPAEYSKDILILLAHELFYLLARNENKADSDIYSSPYVAESTRYILENFSEDVTLFSLAKLMAVSPEHLSRVFKKDTGLGFNEYLNLVRLRNADEMLRSDTKMTISQIAAACGFNDSNYFSDKFKGIYGVSPLKYKKNN